VLVQKHEFTSEKLRRDIFTFSSLLGMDILKYTIRFNNFTVFLELWIIISQSSYLLLND
jgi:hypothetical protein